MNAINVTGNAILVFGLRIGTAGVAIPTLISRMVAAIVITVLLCNQTRILHIERTRKIRFDGRMIRKILAIGVPNGLENSMFQLGKILVLSLVSTFGTYAIAANAVSNAMRLFQILSWNGRSRWQLRQLFPSASAQMTMNRYNYYLKKLLAIIYVAMVGTVALIFLVTSIDFESIQFVRSDSCGSNKYYSFPWNQCNDYLATFICFFQQRIVRQEMQKPVCIHRLCRCGFSGSDSVIWQENIWDWEYLACGLQW